MIKDDDAYIYHAAKAGMPLKNLANKFNTTQEEISRRVGAMDKARASMKENGSDNLIHAFNVIAMQYQLMGQGLEYLGKNLDNPVTPEHIRKVLDDNPNAQVEALLSHFVILHPFKPMEAKVVETKE